MVLLMLCQTMVMAQNSLLKLMRPPSYLMRGRTTSNNVNKLHKRSLQQEQTDAWIDTLLAKDDDYSFTHDYGNAEMNYKVHEQMFHRSIYLIELQSNYSMSDFRAQTAHIPYELRFEYSVLFSGLSVAFDHKMDSESLKRALSEFTQMDMVSAIWPTVSLATINNNLWLR
jgi:hypothetical protein